MYKSNVISINNLSKKFKSFELDIPSLNIPKVLRRRLLVKTGQEKVHL